MKFLNNSKSAIGRHIAPVMHKINGGIAMFKGDVQKSIDSEFKSFEVNNTNKAFKPSIQTSIFTGITSNVILRKYAELRGPSKKYLTEIEDTEGVYSKRDPRVRKSVDDMYTLISKNYKLSKGTSEQHTVYDLYIRACKILNDKKWADTFSTSFKLHKKGYKSPAMYYFMYTGLVYTVEILTLILREYSEMISSGNLNISTGVISNIISKYPTFSNAALTNCVKIVCFCESIKDPKQSLNNIIKAEKGSNAEEDYSISTENSSLYSTEFAAGAFIAVGAGVIGIVAVIHAIRYVIYAFSCTMVDVSKSLVEQSYTLLVNIESLERKLKTLPSNSSEYKSLEKVIERQKYYTEKLVEVSQKLSGDDFKSVDEVRKHEYQDAETINDEVEESEDSGSADDGGFDI